MLRIRIVTGASGYIGGRVAAALAARGEIVLAPVREESRARLPEAGASGRIIPCALPCDDADYAPYVGSEMEKASGGADAELAGVVHLAAISGFTHEEGPAMKDLIRTNIELGARFADAGARAGAATFINAGSFAQNADGDEAYAPNSLYAASKQAFEDILEHYRRAWPMKCVTLRLYDTYGRDDPRPKILNQLARLPREAESFDMTEGGQEMDPVHIDDAVDAFLACTDWMDENEPGARAHFAVRGGAPRTLKETVTLAETIAGRRFPINWGGKPYRPSEIFRIWRPPHPPFWTPSVALEDGLRHLFQNASD